jgi:hypothetical protein
MRTRTYVRTHLADLGGPHEGVGGVDDVVDDDHVRTVDRAQQLRLVVQPRAVHDGRAREHGEAHALRVAPGVDEAVPEDLRLLLLWLLWLQWLVVVVVVVVVVVGGGLVVVVGVFVLGGGSVGGGGADESIVKARDEAKTQGLNTEFHQQASSKTSAPPSLIIDQNHNARTLATVSGLGATTATRPRSSTNSSRWCAKKSMPAFRVLRVVLLVVVFWLVGFVGCLVLVGV